MTVLRVLLALCTLSLVCASPARFPGQSERRGLDFEDDPIGYLTEQANLFLEDFLKEDNVQVTEDVEVSRNNNEIGDVGRSDDSYEDKIENYIKTHDVTFKLPAVGTLTVGARNFDNDELDFQLKLPKNDLEKGRKSKVKKILTPILVFILLKAMTLVPLALGMLLLKAWNALQLSFFSFVISTGLAIFQLCKKIAENNAQAQIAAHGPWEAPAHAARSFNEVNANAQNIAYSAYVE